jgi:RHS repeat-associated protein
VVATYEYDVFGGLRKHEGPADTDFRFTGEQWDEETDFYYLRARYYDPAIGRFVSRDPWPGLARYPQSQNPYAYVLNNPALYVDPYGYWGLGDLWDKTKDVAGAVGGGIKGGAEWTNENVVQPVIDAVQYCTESVDRAWECYERYQMAAIGVDVMLFGGFVAGGGCGVLAPVVGSVTAGIGGAYICGLSITAGGLVAYGGGLITYHAFTPWRHAETAELPGGTTEPSNKE